MSDEIGDLWQRFEAVLAEQHPYGKFVAEAPAAPEAIAELGNIAGPLPSDFVASLELHDGMIEPGAMHRGYMLLPSQIISTVYASTQSSVAPDATFEDDFALWKTRCDRGSYRITGPVKPLWGNPKWLPIMQVDVYCVAIDLDPAPGGAIGQIIQVEDDAFEVLAPSWTGYLDLLVSRLESGDLVYDDQGALEPFDDPFGPVDRYQMPEYLVGH